MLIEDLRAMRAARSYAYNVELQGKVERRLERARTTLESYLLLHRASSAQLGTFRVDLNDGELTVTRASVDDGWAQMNMEDMLAEIGIRQELEVGH